MIELDSESLQTRMASHPEDDYVLATVVKGNADYLVTGDKQLQKITSIGGAPILSPAVMLRIIES